MGGEEEGEREWKGKEGERNGRGIEQRERGGNGRGEEAGKGEGKGWTPRGPGPPKIFGLEPPLVQNCCLFVAVHFCEYLFFMS
jgi:hypothetical protein